MQQTGRGVSVFLQLRICKHMSSKDYVHFLIRCTTTTPSTNIKKGGMFLFNLQKHTNDLGERERGAMLDEKLGHQNVFGEKSPPPLSIYSTPHMPSSSTKWMFTSTPQKQKWKRTHKSPHISSLPYNLEL